MKFKSIFLFFNIVLIFSFGFIFLMPLFAVSPDFALEFWSQSWYMGLGFLLVLLALDGFFLSQWKLFRFLEKEDWAGLKDHLQVQVFEKKKFSSRNIRFYINACLLTSTASDIGVLREAVVKQAPRQAQRWALGLGLPFILEGKGDPVVQYFGEMKDKKGVREAPWLRLAYAFGLMLTKTYGRLGPELLPLTGAKNPPALRLIALYLLNNIRSADPTLGPKVDGLLPGLKSLMDRPAWENYLERARDKHMLLVFLSRLADEALDWLLPPNKKA